MPRSILTAVVVIGCGLLLAFAYCDAARKVPEPAAPEYQLQGEITQPPGFDGVAASFKRDRALMEALKKKNDGILFEQWPEREQAEYQGHWHAVDSALKIYPQLADQ